MMCFVTIPRMLEMINGTRQLLLGNCSCITLLQAIHGLMHCPTSCINHRDVVNADIAGANICPCSRRMTRMELIYTDFLNYIHGNYSPPPLKKGD